MMEEESPVSPTAPGENEITAPPARRRRKKTVSLAEYREKHWGIDAQWRQMQKSSPSFSMRPKTTFGTMLANKQQTSGYKGDLGREFAFTKRKSPTFSMGARPLGHCFEMTSPGPCEYQTLGRNGLGVLDPQNPHPGFPKIPGGRFGASPGAGSVNVIPEKCPGPGDFEIKNYVSSLDGKKPPHYTIRGNLGSSIVAAGGSGLGPGAYDISKTLPNGGKLLGGAPNWTLLGRDGHFNPDQKVPGAGSYSPLFDRNSPNRIRPAYSFGFTERFGAGQETSKKKKDVPKMRQTH